MYYCEYPVPPAVRHAAFCVWRFGLDPDDPAFVMHSVPPDGTTNLLVTITPESACFRRLVGPSLAAALVPVAQGWLYAGLRLRPEAAQAVTGRSPADLIGEVDDAASGGPVFADLEALARGSDGGPTANGIFSELTPVITDSDIASAVDALVTSGGTAALGHLAERCGLGPRQFRRRFAQATGLSPKQYASVQRIRHALILSLDSPSWAEVATEAGFADQAHLARAVRTSFGAAPRQVGGYIGGIRHVFVTDDPFVQDSATRPG